MQYSTASALPLIEEEEATDEVARIYATGQDLIHEGRRPKNWRLMRSRLFQKVEGYEAYGRAFYQMAAEHDLARQEGLKEVLKTLSENFILAEKPLAFVAARYLAFARHTLFGL
jgi:hypothetical protein